MTTPNVLAERYASPEMVAVWSPEAKVVLERRFWIAIMSAQADLGVEIPARAIADYEAVAEQVDLESIAERERVTRHDVKARIEEFNALSGHEHIHKGLTSRDLTENVEQLQILSSLQLLRSRALATLARLAARAAESSELAVTGRTHNVPAQVTTLGKRYANAGEEMLAALARVDSFLAGYRLRGLKGPVGTQQDLLDLLGSSDAVDRLERAVAQSFGVTNVLGSVGQVYPPIAGHRLRECRGAAVLGSGQPGQVDEADGGPGAGDRGLPTRTGRFLGDAAQDELPQLRACRWAHERAVRASDDGRRARW